MVRFFLAWFGPRGYLRVPAEADGENNGYPRTGGAGPSAQQLAVPPRAAAVAG
jgi:hypothetical protein